MQFTKTTDGALIRIKDENGRLVAQFLVDSIAYSAFVSGLSVLGRSEMFADVSLYDDDTQQYIVGTVAQLVG